MINAYKRMQETQNLQPSILDFKKFRHIGSAKNKNAMDNTSFSFAEVSHIKRLLQNQLITNLPDDDFVRLLPNFEPIALQAGEQLDDLTHNHGIVYFPEDAVVSNLYVASYGSTIETSMVGREGLVGISSIFDSDNPTLIPQVTIGGRALKVRADVLKKEFHENERFQTQLLDYLNAHNAEVSRRTACIAFHWAIPRFCTWLLMLHERVGSERLQLTQDQISHALGVHRPSITHAAQSLRSEGLIDYSRGYINIKNLAGLKKAACDCYPETH